MPQHSDIVLGEGSLYERLRRDPAVTLDADLADGTLIYDPAAREVLATVHREYLDIGQRTGLPMVASTATWRTSRDRAAAAGHGVRLLGGCCGTTTAHIAAIAAGLTAD